MSKENPIFFISYSHADNKQKIVEHFLNILEQQKYPNWTLWTDNVIPIGDDWASVINKALKECDFGIILVSAAFAQSKYINSIELPELLKNKKIFPVYLSPYNLSINKALSKKQFFQYELGKLTSFYELLDQYSDKTGGWISNNAKDQLYVEKLVHDIEQNIQASNDNSETNTTNLQVLTFFNKQLLILEFIKNKGTQQYSMDQLIEIFKGKIKSYEIQRIVEKYIDERIFKKLNTSLAGTWFIQDANRVSIKIEELNDEINNINSITNQISESFWEKEQPTNGYSIYISYSQSDLRLEAISLIVESLKSEFGSESVFVASEQANRELNIKAVIAQSKIFLVLVGNQWMANLNNGIREEIEFALRNNLLVIPVLISGAKFPKYSELPESLHPILEIQGIGLDLSHWEVYKSRFLRDIAELLPKGNNFIDSAINSFKSIFSPTPVPTPTPKVVIAPVPTPTPKPVITPIPLPKKYLLPTASSIATISIFISYSHAYETEVNVFVNKLKTSLEGVENSNVNIWTYKDIFLGEDWNKRIQKEINASQISLLLLTDTFFDSNYIKNFEITAFLEEVNKRDYHIIPVYFSPCNYKDWPIMQKLQIFMPNRNDFPSVSVDDFGFTELIYKGSEIKLEARNSPDVNRYFKKFREKLELVFNQIILARTESR